MQYCCGKYLSGKEYPATAEQLMKSRYTAFCEGNIDYLIATLHPNKRQENDRQELTKTINNTTWLGLTIVDINQGKKNDKIGYVEFMAVFKTTEPQQLHERSRFFKVDGKWFYVDGNILPDLILKSSDNCWCGSGKKYKKCHGN
nr:YchJ family protein [Hyella patelloides]